MINKLRAWLDYRARCEALVQEHEHLTKNFDGLTWRQRKLETAYNMSGQENISLKAELKVLKLQSDITQKQLDETTEQMVLYRMERDALQLKLDEALKPRTRVSRAKPPLTE